MWRESNHSFYLNAFHSHLGGGKKAQSQSKNNSTVIEIMYLKLNSALSVVRGLKAPTEGMRRGYNKKDRAMRVRGG